jgi:hypothetical protein
MDLLKPRKDKRKKDTVSHAEDGATRLRVEQQMHESSSLHHLT